MIDKKTKTALNDVGQQLSLLLPDFYGKVTFNVYNGVYVNCNLSQSLQPVKKAEK